MAVLRLLSRLSRRCSVPGPRCGTVRVAGSHGEPGRAGRAGAADPSAADPSAAVLPRGPGPRPLRLLFLAGPEPGLAGAAPGPRAAALGSRPVLGPAQEEVQLGGLGLVGSGETQWTRAQFPRPDFSLADAVFRQLCSF